MPLIRLHTGVPFVVDGAIYKRVPSKNPNEFSVIQVPKERMPNLPPQPFTVSREWFEERGYQPT